MCRRFKLRRPSMNRWKSCSPKDNWKRATNFFNAVQVVPFRSCVHGKPRNSRCDRSEVEKKTGFAQWNCLRSNEVWSGNKISDVDAGVIGGVIRTSMRQRSWSSVGTLNGHPPKWWWCAMKKLKIFSMYSVVMKLRHFVWVFFREVIENQQAGGLYLLNGAYKL